MKLDELERELRMHQSGRRRERLFLTALLALVAILVAALLLYFL